MNFFVRGRYQRKIAVPSAPSSPASALQRRRHRRHPPPSTTNSLKFEIFKAEENMWQLLKKSPGVSFVNASKHISQPVSRLTKTTYNPNWPPRITSYPGSKTIILSRYLVISFHFLFLNSFISSPIKGITLKIASYVFFFNSSLPIPSFA